MMGFFVEQELLGWELKNEPRGEFHRPSFSWDGLMVFVKLISSFMLFFIFIDFVPNFIIAVNENGLANLSFSRVVELAGVSLLFAFFLTVCLVVFTIIAGIVAFCREQLRKLRGFSVKDRVSIRPNSIVIDLGAERRTLKFADYDFYSYGSAKGLKGSELKRFLILVNEGTRVDGAVEIGVDVCQKQVDTVMLGLLPRDYAGDVDFAVPKVAY